VDEVKDPLKEGDFERLVEKYLPRIFNLVYFRVEDYEEARDLTQEIFLKAFKSYSSFRGDSSPYTWLYRIALNHTSNYLKKKGRMKNVSLEEMVEKNPSSLGVVSEERFLDEEKVREKVMALPHQYRDVIVLFYFDQMKVEEISELLGIAPGTVKSRLARGRQILSQWLKDMWGDGR
jgi:RNA polymerase sigma-70 factor (ECF subfamily)